MNINFYRSNFPYAALGGTAAIAALVIVLPAVANSPKQLGDSPEQIQRNQQIYQYAKTITVQINRPPNSVIGQTKDGSGAIVKREGNTYFVLTCNHVVNPDSGPPPVSIRPGAGVEEYPITSVKILGTDTIGSNDLALVTFNSPRDYPVATLRASSQTKQYSKMFVAGYPVNNDTGSIGAARAFNFQKGVMLPAQTSAMGGYTMQYAAQTAGGMSGGPVLDADGKVIGIHGSATKTNSLKLLEAGGVEKDVSFDIGIKTDVSGAIPSNTFIAVIQQNGIGGLQVDNSPSTDNPMQAINNPQTADDWVAKGFSQPSNKTAAINAFSQAIALDPSNSIAYYNRGNARYDQGDKQGAIADYNEAIRLNPNNANAYYNRAVVRYYSGDKQGAVQDFTVALRFNPDDILAYHSRGTILRSLQDGRGAFADFDQVVRLAPNLPQAYYNRGLARSLIGDRNGTIADFSQAIALNPRFTNAYVNRAIAVRRMGQPQAAIADLNAVLSYDQNNAVAYYTRGLFRRDLEDRLGASEDLQRAAALFQQAGDGANYRRTMQAIQQLQSSPVAPPPTQPNFGQPGGEIVPDGSLGPI